MRASVCAVAVVPARMAVAVVDVDTRFTVSSEATRAVIAHVAFSRRSNVRAVHSRKAWVFFTPVGVPALVNCSGAKRKG